MFNSLFELIRKISKALNFLAGIALTFMMLLTVVDVLSRAGGHPIVGVYEVAAFGLAIVIGFGIPQTSLDRGHVYMEFLLEKLSDNAKRVMNTFTRIACVALFLLMGYNLLNVGAELCKCGEVSPTLRLPFYPVAYALAVCSFFQCVVFVFDIARIWRGQYE